MFRRKRKRTPSADAPGIASRGGRRGGVHGASRAPDVPQDEHDRGRREVRKDEPQQAGLKVAREIPRDAPGIRADERAHHPDRTDRRHSDCSRPAVEDIARDQPECRLNGVLAHKQDDIRRHHDPWRNGQAHREERAGDYHQRYRGMEMPLAVSVGVPAVQHHCNGAKQPGNGDHEADLCCAPLCRPLEHGGS